MSEEQHRQPTRTAMDATEYLVREADPIVSVAGWSAC